MHPFYELFQWDIHISAAKRAKVTMDSFLGALAFAAMFLGHDRMVFGFWLSAS